MALKDDPKVQELIEKASAKAVKEAAKAAVAAVKETVGGVIEELGDDKSGVKVAKKIQSAIVGALKAA